MNGLAGTGLAHHTQSLALIEVVRDSVDGFDHTIAGVEVHLQVVDFKQSLGSHG